MILQIYFYHSFFKNILHLIYILIELDTKEREKNKLDREMREMKGEIFLNISAEKAWEMYRDNDKISRINPQMLAKAEYIKGKGEPGSLRCFKLGPGESLIKSKSNSVIFVLVRL